MTTDPIPSTEFDRLAAAWLADGPIELADRVLDRALREVHSTHQRRRLAAPWRTPVLIKYLAAAAAVVAIVAGGFAIAGIDPVGSTPTPSIPPAATASATAAGTLEPSATLSVVDQSSAGYTIAVPADWPHSPTSGGLVFSGAPPMTSLYIWVGQRPTTGTGAYVFGDGSAGANTISGSTLPEILASIESDWRRESSTAPANERQLSVGGEPGWAADFDNGHGFVSTEVVVLHGDRAYNLQLTAPRTNVAELRSTLDQLLASMRWTS